MSSSKRSIFRDSVLQHYAQRRDKDVLPRFLAPPVFVCFWILLGLCLLGGLLIGSTRVPISISVPGVLVPSEHVGQLQALLFVDGDQQRELRLGEPVQLQIGVSGPHLQLVVNTITPQVLSPTQIRVAYHLDASRGLIVTQPSVVAIVTLKASSLLQKYIGSLVNAGVQVGSSSVFSFAQII